MLIGPLFQFSFLAPEDQHPPRPGQRIRWPGEERDWVWDGRAWVALEAASFDGGDAWEDEEGLDLDLD